jgi:hypothetical protein
MRGAWRQERFTLIWRRKLDRIKWRNRFGRGFGPVVWQITDDDDDDVTGRSQGYVTQVYILIPIKNVGTKIK